MDIKERVAAIKAACLIDRPIGYEALKTSKEQTKTSTFKLELVHVVQILFCARTLFMITSNYLKSLRRIQVKVNNGSHVVDTHD